MTGEGAKGWDAVTPLRRPALVDVLGRWIVVGTGDGGAVVVVPGPEVPVNGNPGGVLVQFVALAGARRFVRFVARNGAAALRYVMAFDVTPGPPAPGAIPLWTPIELGAGEAGGQGCEVDFLAGIYLASSTTPLVYTAGGADLEISFWHR